MAKQIPYNVDAEDAILAGILLRPDYADEASVDLSPDDFYSTAKGSVYGAFRKLIGEGNPKPDVVTLADRSGNVMSVDQLVDIMAHSLTFSRSQVEIVLRHSAARQLLHESNRINREILDGADPYEAAVEIERFASRLGSSSLLVEQEALTLEQLNRNAESIAPVVIPGLCHQDYRTIVVAEEGAGKSLLLRTIAMSAAQGLHPFHHRAIRPVRTLVVDLENPAQAILDTAIKLQGTLAAHSADFDDERFRIWRKPGGINIRKLSDRAALQREIAYHRPELVCIGPIYKMYARTGGESYEDSADDAMRVLDDLRTKYGFALYMEHHAAKGKQGEGRDLSPMGSQRWMAWPEIGISLYRDKDDPTAFDVKRFRGDRLSGVGWPDRITRNRAFMIDGTWYDGIPNY